MRCYGNITLTRNVSEYTLVLALCLVYVQLSYFHHKDPWRIKQEGKRAAEFPFWGNITISECGREEQSAAFALGALQGRHMNLFWRRLVKQLNLYITTSKSEQKILFPTGLCFTVIMQNPKVEFFRKLQNYLWFCGDFCRAILKIRYLDSSRKRSKSTYFLRRFDFHLNANLCLSVHQILCEINAQDNNLSITVNTFKITAILHARFCMVWNRCNKYDRYRLQQQLNASKIQLSFVRRSFMQQNKITLLLISTWKSTKIYISATKYSSIDGRDWFIYFTTP